MAFQVGLPGFTLMESGVVRDGVFQDGVIVAAVPIFDVSGPVRKYIRSAQWRQNLATWEHRVRTVNDRKRLSAAAVLNGVPVSRLGAAGPPSAGLRRPEFTGLTEFLPPLVNWGSGSNSYPAYQRTSSYQRK